MLYGSGSDSTERLPLVPVLPDGLSWQFCLLPVSYTHLSDHGETMCSQRTDDPKNSPYSESMNIPFLVRFPDKIQPRVDDLPLFPTKNATYEEA